MKRFNKPESNRKEKFSSVILGAGIILLALILILTFSRLKKTQNKTDNLDTAGNTINWEEEPFIVSNKKQEAELDDILILVNADNPVPEDYKLHLVTTREDYLVDSRMAEDLENLLVGAQSDGVKLWIISAYRGYHKQEELFEEEKYANNEEHMHEHEREESAEKYVARPGTSEHYTGLAVDFNSIDDSFEETDAFAWLEKNCYSYGFILRYPKDKTEITGKEFEPWHYRYVGTYHAEIIQQKGYTLEEYIDYLKGIS